MVENGYEVPTNTDTDPRDEHYQHAWRGSGIDQPEWVGHVSLSCGGWGRGWFAFLLLVVVTSPITVPVAVWRALRRGKQV